MVEVKKREKERNWRELRERVDSEREREIERERERGPTYQFRGHA